jgi:hypothetical protein
MSAQPPLRFSEDEGASYLRFWDKLCDFVTSHPEVSAVEHAPGETEGAEIEFLYEGIPLKVSLK